MSLSSAKKFLVGAVGITSVGYGAYYATQMKEVSKLEKDRSDIAKLIDSEKKKLVSTAKMALEAENRITDLTKQSESATKALKDAEAKLEAARKQLQQVEAAYKARKDEVAKHQSDIRASMAKLAELKAESERAKESVSLSEKSLVLAAQKVDSAKLLLNPLNHPKVAALLNKGKN